MPLPVDYQTCLVTGEWVNIATGEPGVGYVKFTPRATRITTQSEVIVLPTVRRVWLVGGVISEAIPATDDPQVQPLEWTYQVTEVIDGVTYPTYDIEAPVGGTVDLSSVAGVGSAGTIVGIPGPPGPGAVLSNDPAQALGTASAGVGAEGSRDDHVHPMPDASDVGADPAGTAAAAVAAIPDDGPDATPSLRTLGWFAGQAAGGAAVSTSLLTMSDNIADHHAETTTAHGGVVASTDPRLTDARTPTAHAASHQDGGSDELALDGSQITTGTVAPGRLGSGTPSAGTVLHGDGSWVETFAPGGWPAGSTIAMNAPPSAGDNDYAPTLNRSAVIPWTIGRSVTVDQVGLRATTVTGATTDEYRIYLYAPTGTRHPGVRLWVSGLVTFPTTGLHMFSTGSLVTLPPTSIYIVQRVTRFAGSNVRFDSVAFHDETVHSPTLTPPVMWSHNGDDLTGDSPTLSTLVAGFGPRLYLRTA